VEGFEWRNWKILPGAYRAYKRINPEKEIRLQQMKIILPQARFVFISFYRYFHNPAERPALHRKAGTEWPG